ncbi:hypothetical protein HHI36_001317 [Cryptolaemus montrouzieri]|uniref:Uncharacterized protein n=1 Tax=Cryptolaemus montrouzieri TaxID=559131 RepID=A0ABD2P810_9CUCU
MEDTKSLLMMVLQKVFHSRPQIVEDTFQLIYNYNNGRREKKEYETTLKTICDLMNGELSSQILVYLLTMVDMPKEGGCQLPIMEKMQKTHGCLAESVRPHLLECLRNKRIEANEIRQPNENTQKLPTVEKKLEEKISMELPKAESPPKKCSSSEDDCFIRPAKRPKKVIRGSRKAQNGNNGDQDEVPSLTDLCANFCVRSEKYLRKMYKSKLDHAWLMVNENRCVGKELEKCYEVIRYLNRMMKLVRMVENTEVTTELLMEEYTDIDIFIREKHLQAYFKWDPFEGM